MSEGSGGSPERDFDSFARRHAGWLGRVPAGPLYCLPESTIARLGQPGLGRSPLLDESAERAERDLLDLCRRHRVVGYDGRRPIDYPYLSLSQTPAAWWRALPAPPGWSDAHWGTIEEVLAKVNQANLRLGGYAGWLSTEPPFLDAVRGLATRWRALPDDLRPDFPLRRPAVVGRAPDWPSPAPEAVRAFAADFASLCDRWGLIGMATWDLPLPQGPLLPSLLPAGSPALPARGVHLVLPLHYPLAGDDDLLKEILNHQQSLADELGLDASVAGLPHHKAYARILEVVHHERTVTGRYAGAGRPPGFVGVLVEALAEGLGQSVDQVQRARKVIAACRRGRRADVGRLRPRNR